ncbi:MAG: hypothetical protein GHCLOJNM_04637 [bacterium]|nr:hypothetical protein [bacterium]
MRIWRLVLRPTSLQLSQWQADTLFGALCWKLAFREGESGLLDFLAPFLSGDPPFLISDGIPSGFLPLPLHLKVTESAPARTVEDYQKEKQLKKIRFITEAEFAKACNGQRVGVDVSTSLSRSVSQLHASINRNTGTTTRMDDEGTASLFQLDGWVPEGEGGSLSVFVADRTGKEIDRVLVLLRDMELTGFGKKKSSGMGAFQIEGDPVEWRPPQVSGRPNGFVSFAGFVPAQRDPTAGFWRLRVKHAKLGETFATGGKPFKTPFIQFESGSTFLTGDEPGEVYGRVLRGLSEEHPQVVQYGYAFPVPLWLPDLAARLAS